MSTYSTGPERSLPPFLRGLQADHDEFFDFSSDPAYYQTRWFQALSVATFLGGLWAVHRFRLHRIAHQFNIRLEERVGERTRIARELHDTLLQSFHGLIFRFQAVDNLLPSRPGEAKQTLESALDDAAQAITDARDAVHELRSSTVVTNDLAAAVTALGRELAGHPTTTTASQDLPTVLVEVEGTPQDLHPILRDEIYRIVQTHYTVNRQTPWRRHLRRAGVTKSYGEPGVPLRAPKFAPEETFS